MEVRLKEPRGEESDLEKKTTDEGMTENNAMGSTQSSGGEGVTGRGHEEGLEGRRGEGGRGDQGGS